MKHVSVYLGTFAVLSALAGCGGTSTTATTTQTSSPSFSLQVLPSSVTLTAGGTSQVLTGGASPVNNFRGSVAIKLGSLPAGVSNALEPFSGSRQHRAIHAFCGG